MCDCICNQPQYANHGTICPLCEEERDLRDRIMEDNQREYEWLEREAREEYEEYNGAEADAAYYRAMRQEESDSY